MERIRISAATIVRIELNGKLLLGLNKKRRLAGRNVYTPFGGGLEFHESARPFLESLEAVFVSGNDLRLMISEDKLPVFEKWFNQRQHRELSPYRELLEELVDEEKVLPELPENEITLEYLLSKAERAITDRPGQEGSLTQRYYEVYKAKFSSAYEQMIRLALVKSDTHLALVTEQEILAESASGVKIGSNCIPLIHK